MSTFLKFGTITNTIFLQTEDAENKWQRNICKEIGMKENDRIDKKKAAGSEGKGGRGNNRIFGNPTLHLQ